MTPIAWLTPDIVEDLGWTLVHFLWQGLALALALRVILAICRSAVARYNWSLSTLIVMLLSPVATFLILHRHVPIGATSLPRIVMDAVTIEPGIDSPAWPRWLVAIWSSGIIVLSLRALGGWYLTERLRRRSTFQLPALLVERFQDLQRRVAIARPVLFLQSALVATPAVIGWLRPVVLIPASALTGLTPRQLEAVIVHELAHVKRLDALANLLQVAVETVLFYHPAVWWASRRIRAERENCCDDIAVAICDDAVDYAKALTALETWRSMPAPALAATGGELKQRVLRLLGRRTKIANVSLSAFVAAALFLLFGGVAAQSAIGEIAAAKAIQSVEIPAQGSATVRPVLDSQSNEQRIQNPKPSFRPPPTYPARAEEREIEGYVDIDFTIQPDGSVGEPKVKAEVPEGFGFADAAMAVFPIWKFESKLVNGKPTSFLAKYRFSFKLKRDPATDPEGTSQPGSDDKRRSDAGGQENALQVQIDEAEAKIRELELKREEFQNNYYDLLPTGEAGSSHFLEARTAFTRIADELNVEIEEQEAGRRQFIWGPRDAYELGARRAPFLGVEYLKLDRDYADAKRSYDALLARRDSARQPSDNQPQLNDRILRRDFR